MEMPFVSIIVPVYNAQSHLSRCLESICGQEYKNLELIVINDGSKDKSLPVCEEFRKKDSRILLVDKANSGVSDTRNLGLKLAGGKYVQFVDSDDYIDPGFTQHLVEAAEAHHADLVIAPYKMVIPAGATKPEQVLDKLQDELGVMTVARPPEVREYGFLPAGVYTQDEFARHLMDKPASYFYGVLWNKLYRRAIFAQLRYPEGKLNEDIFVLPEICLNTKKAVVVPKELYYYVQRGSSIMNGSKTLRHFDAAEAAQRYWNCLVENEVYDALANAAKFTMGSVSRVYRQLPPALRKAPRSREMLRMQFDVVDRTRQYCTVPAGLWLQSLLLRLFPREYMWLRNIKGRGELKIA